MGEGMVCYKQGSPQSPFNIWWSALLESISLPLKGFLVSIENRCADKWSSPKGRLDSLLVCWSVKSKPVTLSLVTHEGYCYSPLLKGQ